ncbi:hypothetical protein [Spiroplasma monobiae]|uniref:Uncharacterized protein n=1 Tax=Spiroplasma monobiae MQ-1 TaxID=1336748 RepID=A0A2K9LYV8_SPISQ|nr:hypothetical protein [Spiroplasma monobiae]AUM62944.1 hypothetical protein SMONO_v1c06950 [Spiroplasma monobiae MQ-1]
MDQKNKDISIDQTQMESDQAKKRLDEIKQSNSLINSQVTANNFYVPKRKIATSNDAQTTFIKPRKKKNLPFSNEQQKEIEKTMLDVRSEYRDNLKEKKTVEKKLLKEEIKLSRLISKTNKKIGTLIDKENTGELEKTVEMQSEYLNAFDKIHDDINTLVLSENKISLEDRRKHIYNNAYNAETERARKLVQLRNENRASWTNQIKESKKNVSKRKSNNWMERLGILDDEE